MENIVYTLENRINKLDVALYNTKKDIEKRFDNVDERFGKTEERAKEHSQRLDMEELQRSTVIAKLNTHLVALTVAWAINTTILASMAIILILCY